jgi:hypothetical protein
VNLSKVVLKPVDGSPTQAVKASSLHAIICVEEDDVAAGSLSGGEIPSGELAALPEG